MAKLKHKSRATAVQNLKRMFKNTPEDHISLQDVFVAWGRDLSKEVDNKAWLSNKLTHIKYHDLITPVYSYNTRPRRLERLELTLEGKRELGRIGATGSSDENSTPSSNGHSSASLADLTKLVKQFQKENAEFEVTFSVRLKEIANDVS